MKKVLWYCRQRKVHEVIDEFIKIERDIKFKQKWFLYIKHIIQEGKLRYRNIASEEKKKLFKNN